MPRTSRLLIWVVLILLLVPGQLAWLYVLRGPSRPVHEHTLIWGHVVLGAACVAMLALLRTTPPDAIRLTPRASVLAVVAGTLVLQVAAVVLLAPPSRAASDAPIPRATGGACAAVAAVALLAVALRRAGESPWHAALLGWNPLLTLVAGTTGRAEAVGVALVAAVLAASAARRFKLAGAALALACGVKPHALLLLPFLWRRVHERRSFRAGRRVVLVFCATLAVVGVVAAALLARQRGAAPFADLTHFGGGGGEGNALLYESFQSIFGAAGGGRTEAATDAARLVGVLVVLGMGMLLWQSRATPAEAGYWLFMFGLLFAPGVRPESLLWALVFVPRVRGPQGFAALTWAATVAAGFPPGREGATTGTVRPAWLVAEYLPVLCVLAVEVLRLARVVPLGRAVQSPGSPVPT